MRRKHAGQAPRKYFRANRGRCADRAGMQDRPAYVDSASSLMYLSLLLVIVSPLNNAYQMSFAFVDQGLVAVIARDGLSPIEMSSEVTHATMIALS